MNTFGKCEKRAASRITQITLRDVESGIYYPPPSDTRASASAGPATSKPARLSPDPSQVEGRVNEAGADDTKMDESQDVVVQDDIPMPETGDRQSSGVSESDDDNDSEEDEERSSRDEPDR